MKVEISDITRFDGATMNLEFEEPPLNSEPVDGYKIDEPVSFKGSLSNKGGILELNGLLRVRYKTACYRCLKEIEGQLEIKVRDDFVNGRQYADEIDAYAYEGNLLDTGKALEDDMVLSLPMKQVCNKDCKGLCRICGKNLNEAECNCKEDNIDPRMEELGKFFNN